MGIGLQHDRDLGRSAGHEPPELDPQRGRDGRALPCPAGQADRRYREAWKEAGHAREPRISVSRSIFALVDDRDRSYFGHGKDNDQIGIIDNMRAIFGRSYAAEPDRLVEELKADEAIAEADTLLLTVPTSSASITTPMSLRPS